jgi:hypothetical protein
MSRTMRNFRLDDETYAAAQQRAKREYTTVTAVIERYLAEYGGLIDTKKAAAEFAFEYPSASPKEQQARGKR